MDDIKSLYPKTHVSRRGFVAATTVGAGFALAAQPIQAQTVITTDANGLMAGDASIPTPNGAIYGYYAMPGTGGPFPIVVVIQEIFGVHEHIKDVCRRFAKAGYLAVAPDLHGRQGDTTKAPDIQAILAIVSKVRTRRSIPTSIRRPPGPVPPARATSPASASPASAGAAA